MSGPTAVEALEALGLLGPEERAKLEAWKLAAWKLGHPGLAPSVDELAAVLHEAVTPERVAAAFAQAASELLAFWASPRGPVRPGDDPSVDA